MSNESPKKIIAPLALLRVVSLAKTVGEEEKRR